MKDYVINSAFQQQQLSALTNRLKPTSSHSSTPTLGGGEVGDEDEHLKSETEENESINSDPEDAKRRRTRTNFTQWQINELEKAFK